MSRRTYIWNAFETTLNGAITAGATTLTLNSVTNLRAPGFLVIDRENASKREYIKFTGISTNDLTGLSRGESGSAGGTGQAHDDGASVRCVTVHQIVDDIFSDIVDLEAQDAVLDAAISALEAADTAHFGSGGAVHADATASVAGFMTAADFSKLAGIEPGATGDQSAAEILSLLSTVDGSGSALDADYLDGLDSLDFVQEAKQDHRGIRLTTSQSYTNVGVSVTGYVTDHAATILNVPSDWYAYYVEVEVTGTVQKDTGVSTSENLDIRILAENEAGTLTEIREFTNILANASQERIPFAIKGWYTAESILRANNPSNFGVLQCKTTSGGVIYLRDVEIIATAWRLDE